jgi:hypothetical protein
MCTTVFVAETDTLWMTSVGAIDTLVTRVARVEGNTVTDFTMAEDEFELETGGATVGTIAAFPSKMSA